MADARHLISSGALLITGLLSDSAFAQILPAVTPAPPQTTTLTSATWQELPTSANVFAMMETIHAEVVTDRFNAGGLNVGGPARVGGLFSSTTQTQYRVGDINITSAIDGTPLFFPELGYWERVAFTTGMISPDASAPGLVVSLEPIRPAIRWRGTIEGAASHSNFVASSSPMPPAIASLRGWSHGSAHVSGSFRDRQVGLVTGAAWTRNRTVVRGNSERRGEVVSAFARANVVLRTNSELRTLVWMQRARETSTDVSAHVQSTFERSLSSGSRWKVFGGYTQRRHRPHDVIAHGLVVDRLVAGPIPQLVAKINATERRWSIGARASPVRRGRHTLHIGGDLEHTVARLGPPFNGGIGELVDGRPARIWTYTSPGLAANRDATSLSAFISDGWTLSSRLIAASALRVERVTGRADGAATGIEWLSLLPSGGLRWRLGTRYDLALVTGYRRSPNQLLLSLLEYGDPAAPVATVSRWSDVANFFGPIVARVGPGTGGNPAFSGIDRELKRAHTDELAIGVESQPRTTLRLSVTGRLARQSSLINVLNTGVGLDGYTTFTIRDDSVDLVRTADDQQLTIYNRLPASFGQDRYLLTNPNQDAATHGAIVITAQAANDKLFVLAGATASAAVGAGGSRGFRAGENDQDAIGELFTNPNASTFARGRLFSDRAYTIKVTTIYRFPHDVRLGTIARYQDGQPFSRLVVVRELSQGGEAVQAFANGRSRFAFTGTLDVRLQKRFAVGARQLDVMVDAYNLLDMKKEVEEYVVTGSRFRTPTAVQPPRAFHLGVRLSF